MIRIKTHQDKTPPWMAGSVLVVVMLALTACAPARTGAGKDPVTQLQQSTNYRLHWYTGSDEDHQVHRAIDDLLSQELTAAQTIQIALLNNRGLQATYQELGLAQADLVQAGLLSNPVFSGSVLIPVDGGRSELDLGVAQNFLEVLSLPMRKRMAESGFEEAKLRVTVAVYDLIYQTRLAFYRAQACAQRVEMYEQIVLATELSYDFARRLREAGNITELALARQRERYELARLTLRQAEAEHARQREEMTRLMGVFGQDTQWRIAGRLADVPEDSVVLDDLESQVIGRSLDLAIARQRILTAGQRLGFDDATAWFDELELGAEATYEDAWSVGPSWAVPIPLFDRGQGRVARSRAELRQQQERYTQLAIELRSMAREARIDLELAADTAEHYRQVILPLRQKIVNETQLQYNAMQAGLFELLDARQQQVRAGEGYITAVLDYWVAQATIDQMLLGRMAADGGMADQSADRLMDDGAASSEGH